MRAPNHYYSNKNLSSPVCQPYRHLNYSHFLMTNKVISMICCNNNTKWLSENHTHSLSINERDCRFKWNASADATYMQNRMMPAKINCHHCERGNAFTKCFIMYLVVQLYIVHWTWSMKQDKTKTKNQIHWIVFSLVTITYVLFSVAPQTAELNFSLLSINRKLSRDQRAALHA